MGCHGFPVPERESRLCAGGLSFQPQTQQVLVGTMKTPTNVPSQKNISQTRSTEAQGRVRAKMHMNHSVM